MKQAARSKEALRLTRIPLQAQLGGFRNSTGPGAVLRTCIEEAIMKTEAKRKKTELSDTIVAVVPHSPCPASHPQRSLSNRHDGSGRVTSCGYWDHTMKVHSIDS